MDRVAVFKALGDENRLQILELLKKGEHCGCTLLETLEIAQSTLSHHLKILVESGLVDSRKEGKWTYYSISDHGGRQAIILLTDLMKKSDDYVSVCESC